MVYGSYVSLLLATQDEIYFETNISQGAMLPAICLLSVCGVPFETIGATVTERHLETLLWLILLRVPLGVLDLGVYTSQVTMD